MENFFSLVGSKGYEITGDNPFLKMAEKANLADDNFQKWLKTVKSSGKAYKNSEQALAGYQSYLQSTAKSFDFAALKATALDMALNAGIILAVTLAVKVLATVWDNVNVTVAEQQEKLDEIKCRY